MLVGGTVAAPQIYAEFRSEIDEVVYAATPDPFMAVGAWYRDFTQTSDQEVRDLLELAAFHPVVFHKKKYSQSEEWLRKRHISNSEPTQCATVPGHFLVERSSADCVGFPEPNSF